MIRIAICDDAPADQQLLKNLELPEHLTPNALLETLNLLMSREEFYEQ